MKAHFIRALLLWMVIGPASALSERHLMVVRHGEGECDLTHTYHTNPDHAKYVAVPLTDRGQQQVKKTADTLLNNGFDNRSIAAVYVSPLPRAIETAQILANIGVISADKIHIDKRLIDIQAGDRESAAQSEQIIETWLVGAHEALSYRGESNIDVRTRMLAFYDEVEAKHPKGHIIIITHGIPSMELIDSVGKQKVKLELAQVYVVPLANRKQIT